MRLVKNEQEVAVLREAGAICADALTACMRATAPGVMEYQLAGVLEYRYRVSGSRGALLSSDHRRRHQRLVRALQRQRRAAGRRPGAGGLRPRPPLYSVYSDEWITVGLFMSGLRASEKVLFRFV